MYLALPMILRYAITNLVSFLNNIMVGQLGTEQMSGVAIVNSADFCIQPCNFWRGFRGKYFSGAQYFGKGNHKGHMYSFRFKLYAVLLYLFVIQLFLSKRIRSYLSVFDRYKWYRSNGVGIAVWIRISCIMLFGLIPFAVNQAYATNIKKRTTMAINYREFCSSWY